jgi:glycerate kinase
MHVLIAFDKFKDCLTAQEACRLTADALRERQPAWTTTTCPLADGGEGFAEILTDAAGGEHVVVTVTGPRGAPVSVRYGLVAVAQVPSAARRSLGLAAAEHDGARIAVVDMASVSGLALLAPADRDPWETTTRGTGEVLRLAAARGVAAIVLGVGGSATSDLGLGALAALGLEFHGGAGRIGDPVPAHWAGIERIGGAVAPLPPVWIACDVTNPLLGPRGAAATYGPQKGLKAADLPRLDHESGRLALMLCSHCGRPDALMDVAGAGAAGGISFGLMAAAGAKLLPGFDLVSAWLDLETHLARAELVITGEGRFDATSLQGKGPGAVAARGLALGKAVHVFAGQAAVDTPPARLTLHSITPAGLPLAEALPRGAEFLAAAVRRAF